MSIIFMCFPKIAKIIAKTVPCKRLHRLRAKEKMLKKFVCDKLLIVSILCRQYVPNLIKKELLK
jgi:hypothetical protein